MNFSVQSIFYAFPGFLLSSDSIVRHSFFIFLFEGMEGISKSLCGSWSNSLLVVWKAFCIGRLFGENFQYLYISLLYPRTFLPLPLQLLQFVLGAFTQSPHSSWFSNTSSLVSLIHLNYIVNDLMIVKEINQFLQPYTYIELADFWFLNAQWKVDFHRNAEAL